MSVAQSGEAVLPPWVPVYSRCGLGPGRPFLGVITQEGARLKAGIDPACRTILHWIFALFTCHKPSEA